MKVYVSALVGLMMSFNLAVAGGSDIKNYYLMEKGYTCSPFMIALPGAERPQPKPSWKNKISVVDGKQATVFGDACNDSRQGIGIKELRFSASGKKIIYQGQVYIHKVKTPFQ